MIVIKQPSERRLVDELGGPYSAAAIVATHTRSGAAVGSFTAQISLTAGALTVTVAGGIDGESYLVTIDATVADTSIRRIDIEVAVILADWTMPDGGAGYLTIAEFVDRFGLDEVVRMTDRSGAGRIDRDYLVSALRDAQGLADINLGARYLVPLAVAPDAIKTVIADLARARLYPRGAPDGVADATKAANALLARIASGALPLALPAGAAAAEAASDAPVLITPGWRAYPDALDGY